MLTQWQASFGGWFVVGVMLSSGLILGALSDRLLRLVGLRDRGEGR